MLVIGLLIGVVIGFCFACLGMINMKVGDLRIDNSDPNETYMFLELTKGVGDISNRNYVVLKVNPRNYISQN